MKTFLNVLIITASISSLSAYAAPKTTDDPTYCSNNGDLIKSGNTSIKLPVDIVLHWDGYPSDLDSHTVGRDFTIYFGNKNYDKENLKVYDRNLPYLFYDYTDHYSSSSANKAEQTRITQNVNGFIDFYIYNYSGGGDYVLSDSKARVTIHQEGKFSDREATYLGCAIATFEVPKNKAGRTWHVFRMNIKENKIIPVNKIYPEKTDIKFMGNY